MYMAARHGDKARLALEGLQEEGLAPGHGEVIWLELDLSNPRKARQAAEIFLGKEQRLDVLGTSSLLAF